MKNCKNYLLSALLCSVAVVQVCAQVPEVVLVGKTDNYVQTSSATPVIDINFVGPPEYSQRYQFNVRVNATADLSGIPAPTVTLAAGSTAPAVIGAGHNGGVLVWNANEGSWSYGTGGFNWATNDAVTRDALFAEGVYTVNVLGTAVNLNLVPTAFGPNTPQVTLTGGTWAGGKYYIDVSQALTITTNEFANYDQNANGAIGLSLWDQNGPDLLDDTVVHSATPLGLPVAPASKSLTRTIAPGTLVAGRTYTGNVTFSAVIDQVAGAPGSALANSLNLAIRERTTNLTIVAYTGKIPFVSLYGVGDLPGGVTVSSVRDATKVNGVIYAVGGSNEKGGSGVTAATLWTSAAGLVALPDLAVNTSTGGIEAFAITHDGAYIASRAHASSVAADRRAVRVTTNGLVNLELGSLVPVPASSVVSAISDDGAVLYGGAQFVAGGKNQMVRYMASGPTATAIPFLNAGDDTNNLPLRGASSDGTVAVGTSTSSTATTVGTGPGNRAFRYLQGTGVSAIPLLAGGTWNAALAVTPDGNLVLVRGNSTAFPNGEIYLYNAATTSITPLGSPNATLVPGGNARMTAGGSAVLCAFGSTTYVRNSTGWHLFTAILTGTGVDLTGWNITAFQGMSPDGTLVCGVAAHNTFTEGYVLELPAGYLADAAPVITSPLTANGTYGQLFNYTITATNQADDFDSLNLPATLSVNHGTGSISGLLSQAGVFPVTISAANYFGTDIKQLLLTVAPASASIQLDNLFQVYDGFPKFVTATTTPAGHATTITYDGSATAPTNAGNYAVVAAMADANYAGSAGGMLTVAQATATVVISGTSQIYDGAPKPITVSTTPSGLNTIVTYNGGATVPTNAGSYGVNATVNELNYTGSAGTTLTVGKGTATISLSNMVQPYDGSPHAVTVTTNPAGVAFNILYDGSSTAPSGVGSYPVAVSLNDANYNSASASGTLTITDNSVLPTQASLHGISDLTGGVYDSQVRDAVRVNGALYAVGYGSVNASADTAVIWMSSGGLTPLPNLAAVTTGSTAIIASAITPGARYIASRALFNPGSPGFRHAVRVTTNGLGNIDLGYLPGNANNVRNSVAAAISDDGAVLYGFARNATGFTQAVRYTASGPTIAAIPFLNVTDTSSAPAGRGTSADGSVMVGNSSNNNAPGFSPSGRGNAAFRYVHGSGISAIPFLAGGTWSLALAVSPDGNLALVAGDSSSAPQGEVYLHNAAAGTTTSLGTPNGSRGPNNFGGMNADGSVVAMTFNALDNPTSASYVRNSHGWHELHKVAAAAGVDLTGWTLSGILGMSRDGTLVWGSGLHNGNNEGFIAEFPAGFLAGYTEPAVYSTPAPAIVGAWTVGDTSTLDSAVLIFFSNGYYMHIERGGDSSSADGLERGQYTWNAATGAFSCTTLFDTTGDTGLGGMNGVAGVTLTVSGDTLTASIPGEPDPVVLSRVVGSSPIVGAWGDATVADQSAAIVFLSNGHYFMAQDGDSTPAGDPNGHDGMEWGTYAWNSATGALTATTLIDSNGEWGLSHPQGTLILSVSSDLRTLTGNSGAFALPRVGPAMPIITLGNLAPTYDGTQKSATVTTSPAGIATSVSYGGDPLRTNAGSYSVVATITDPLYTGSVSSTLSIGKATATVNFSGTTQVYDGSTKSVTVGTLPGSFATTVTYDGGPAPSAVGTYGVNAIVDDPNYIGSGTTTLTITKGTATVDLGNLSLIYDGLPKVIVPVTNPVGLATSVTYDGSATAPTIAGSYAIVATVTDANYAGSNSGTLNISSAAATVALGNLVQAYNGTPRPVSVTTNPVGLAVDILYDGQVTAPVAMGSYSVSAVINQAGYTGSANGTLMITSPRTSGTVVAFGLNNSGQCTVPAGLTGGVTAVSAGAYHTVVLKGDGTIAAWGWNDSGQTVVPAGLSGVIAIAAGSEHTVALKSDGTVSTWGMEFSGTVYDHYGPAAELVPPGLGGVTAIAAGFSHTLALKSDGTVVCWGHGTSGQSTPPVGLTDVIAITAGSYHSVALKSNGEVVAWGGNQWGQTTVPAGLTGVIAIAAGSNHTVALKSDGTVVAWGMGHDYPGGPYDADHQAYVPPGLSGVVAIAAGGNTTLALKDDGTIVSWGNNGYGQISPLSALDGVIAIAVADVGQHTVALVSSALHQNIAFGSLPDVMFGSAPIVLSATATSGLPVGFSVVSGPATLAGNTVTLTGAGTVIIRASQSGDTYYSPARNVERSFIVSKAPSAITWAPPAPIAYGTALSGDQLNATADVAGSFAYNPALGAVLNAGTQLLNVTFTPTDAANYSGASAQRTLAIGQGVASFAFGNLNQVYDAAPKPVSVTTTPVGLATTVTYEGSTTPPTNAGTYAVVATVTDANYTGSGSGTLTIAPVSATVTLSNLTQIYDGTPKPVASTTVPAGLTVDITYNGSPTAPTTTGSYAVSATVNNANYVGSATGTLVIGLAPLQIVTQPANTTVTAGQTATFTVVATGTGPITYQWRKGTTNIAGATNAAYSIPNAQSGDAGNYRVVVSNVNGPITSAVASLTVLVPPAITVQPVDVTKNAGQNASFTVTATGTATLLYQWRKDGADIAGATTKTLSLTGVTSANEGLYSVVVSNGVGSPATSTDARLTVNVAPAIVTQPVPVTVSVGSPATFSVVASGTAPLTYQWRKGTVDIPGATSSSYTIPSAQSTDAANYRVVVTNAANSVNSTAVSLTVLVSPAITTQPVDVTKTAGQNTTFSVTATGSATLLYQWRKDGVDIAGATARTLPLTAVTPANEGVYSVVVSNGAGFITSVDARLTVLVKPTITTQPAAVTINVGGTANFTVVPAGTAPFTYQWRRNGTAIAGATAQTLTLTNVLKAQAGNYSVIVTNAAGSITSANAALVVN